LLHHFQAARDRLAVHLTTGFTTVVGISLLVVALVAAVTVSEFPSSGAPAHPSPTASAGNPQLPFLEHQMQAKTPVLPAATVPPVAAPASVATAAPLSPHEVFGFVPYWSLGQGAGFSVAGLTTLDYFAVGLNANGSLDKSGAGWNGYESQALSDLITQAHGAGIRVVLTVNDFDQHSLDELTSNPAAATTLANALVGAVQAKSLDGVNLDLEGEGSGDQAGLTRLVTTVSNALHQVDPHWQVTMDTYASSAGDPSGFYDISALASAVDGFFVMEYSPNIAAGAQATSPLTSSLFSDLTTVQQYAAAAPASKVILGMPLYGDDWATSDNSLSATATGPATTLSDSQIEAAGNPTYWDPVTDSAWTAYLVGTQWHETFFDDPTSFYEIAHLANQYGLGGVGLWALGPDGTDPAMVNAADDVPPAIAYATPPTPSSASTTTTTAPPSATTNVPSITPQESASGGATDGASGAPASSGTGGNASGTTPSALAPSLTGTFEAEALASIEDGTPASSLPSTQSVTLCTVTTSGSQNAGCAAPDPSSVQTTPSTTAVPSTTAAGVTPPFPGATVVGVLSGFTVQNETGLSCLQSDNQLAEIVPSSANTTPQLVVWQLPNDQQYYYVVASTMPRDSEPADCANALLAFPVPSQPSAPAG
jgi:hypothetical protein